MISNQLYYISTKKQQIYMGSLMAGWDSLSQDPKTVNLERNKSNTREEIESFRRSHKTPEHHQHEDVTTPQSFSNSLQFLRQGSNGPIDVAKAYKTKAWWTKSNWAFLNDPPQETHKSASNYAAQFHVAHGTPP